MRRCSIAFVLLVCTVHPYAAVAQATVAVVGAVNYTYNSNVFYAQSGTVPGLSPGTGYADSYTTYTGSLDLGYQSANQKLHADLTGSDFQYRKFTQLSHQEYKLDAGWTGTFWSVWNGKFDVIRDRMMEPFLDLTGVSVLGITTAQREEAGFGVQFRPAWRAEASGYTNDSHWPLPGEPNAELKESEGDVSLKYLGSAAVTSGVRMAYLTGTYSGNTNEALNTSYRQWSAGILASYASGHSNFTGVVSYSDRTSPGTQSVINSLSGVTAALNYFNQLTGKTSVTVNLTRAFNPYPTNLGSEIDNAASVTLGWDVSYRIRVDGTYTYDYAQYPGQGNNPIGGDRLDHLQTAAIDLNYRPRPWFSLKPYASYNRRTSNFTGGDFNVSEYGVKLTLTWP
jgi:hypothetical protein